MKGKLKGSDTFNSPGYFERGQNEVFDSVDTTASGSASLWQADPVCFEYFLVPSAMDTRGNTRPDGS